VVEIPYKIFPRLIFLPKPTDESERRGHPFVLLEDVALAFASELFPGYDVVDKGFLRLTRAAELTLDEEKDEDFMRVMTEALRRRHHGDIMRLELNAPPDMVRFLAKQL